MGAATGTLEQHTAGPGRMQTVIVIVVATLLVGGLAWFVKGGADDGVTSVSLASSAGGAGPVVGQAPPGFTGRSHSGNPISLADYAGKPLWLTFGASWCTDCRVEAADIGNYVRRAGLTFPIIADERATIVSPEIVTFDELLARAEWVVGRGEEAVS